MRRVAGLFFLLLCCRCTSPVDHPRTAMELVQNAIRIQQRGDLSRDEFYVESSLSRVFGAATVQRKRDGRPSDSEWTERLTLSEFAGMEPPMQPLEAGTRPIAISVQRRVQGEHFIAADIRIEFRGEHPKLLHSVIAPGLASDCQADPQAEEELRSWRDVNIYWNSVGPVYTCRRARSSVRLIFDGPQWAIDPRLVMVWVVARPD